MVMRLLSLTVLTLSLARACHAGENDCWQVSLRACGADGYQTQFNCDCGTRPSSSDGLDAADAALSSANQNCAWITSFDLGPGYGFGYYADWRSPVASAAKTWNLKLRAGSAWPEPVVYLRVWNPAGTFDINGSIPISLIVANDPTGTYPPGYSLIPRWDADKNGTWASPAYTFAFGNASVLKAGAAVELQLTAGSGTAPVSCTIGEARRYYSGIAVSLSGVTASSGSSDNPGLWVASEGLPGLRVLTQSSVLRGEIVDVEGLMGWSYGVPVLSNASVKARHGAGPVPLRCLPSRHAANDPREALAYWGINTVGMLCVVCGTVTARDAGAGVFYVDDGSNLQDGLGPQSAPYTGLRISCGTGITPPPVGARVRVTGIRSVEKHVLDRDAMVNGELRFADETLYVPVILIRDSADIRTLSP